MNAARFATQRDRIMSEHGRSNAWRKRALAMLVRRAQALPNHAANRTVSWSLPAGQVVCIKRRYTSEQQAIDAIGEMHREQDGRRKPIRAYPCVHCFGWHITSRA